MRVLLVEDDPMIGEEMQRALKKESYAVDWVKDGAAALSSLALQDYGFVLLDLGLPKKDGLLVLKELREKNPVLPVIIVSARDTLDERILGLDQGADDYVLKPFAMSELLARLRATLRRKSGSAQPILSNGILSLDPQTHLVRCGEIVETLPAKEYALLHALLLQPGCLLSRARLEDQLYGWNEEVESNAVEYLIHSLRKKLGKASIINVRGAGWMVSRES